MCVTVDVGQPGRILVGGSPFLAMFYLERQCFLEKSVCCTNLRTISVLLMFFLPSCDYDDNSAGGDGTDDGSSVLISTIPSNGGVLPSHGTLYMTFSDSPGIVIVNGELAIVAGNIAIWNASGLTSGQTVLLLITWTGNGGGTKTVLLTVL